jgi:multiple sugar transport system substrate-binding protein
MAMKKVSLAVAFAFATQLLASAAFAKTEIVVHYAWPAHQRFHEAVAKAFMEKFPDISVTFRTPSPDYEDAVQTIVRQSMANQLPDIEFAGLPKVRELASRGIAVPLDKLITSEADFGKMGYSANVLSLGAVNGVQYAVPFAISTPVIFYNADLVLRAGGDPDHFPTTWEGVIALGGKIAKLGNNIDGMYYEIGVDDWTTQALIFNFGGRMTSEDEKKVAFDGPAGKRAIALFGRLHSEGGQKPVTQRAARQQFLAGLLGMYAASPANVRGFEEGAAGKFRLRTATLPLADKASGGVPTGGMAMVILTKDPERQSAAWKYLKFATGPEGQTIVVKNTGYMPANTLALQPQYLGRFYEENPSWETAAKQLPVARAWYAWPGTNSVKIGRVLADGMTAVAQGVVTPEQGLAQMATETQALLPK